MESLTSNKNLELITYIVLIAYIVFHPNIPYKLKSIISHPIIKFAFTISIIYLAPQNGTIALLLTLCYISTYLSCTHSDKFSNISSEKCISECNNKFILPSQFPYKNNCIAKCK